MKGIILLVLLVAAQSGFAACVATLTREAPDARYEVDGALITDRHTGLIWSRCPLGLDWSQSSQTCLLNSQQPQSYTWGEALQAAATATTAGYTDWRLPNKNELSSLIDRACSNPAMNNSVFSIGTTTYWTSTPGRREEGYAWHVNFLTGTLIVIDMESEFAVRLVRN